MNIHKINTLLEQLTEAILNPISPIGSLDKSKYSDSPAARVQPKDFEMILPMLVSEYIELLNQYEADCAAMGMPGFFIDKYGIEGRVEGLVTTQEEIYWFLMCKLGRENFTHDFYLRFVTELEKKGLKVITRRPIGVYRKCPSYTTGL